MNAMYKITGLALCLLLGACGNKGDLYLNPVELTDEQKALLNDLDQLGAESEPTADDEDDANAKKKKANLAQPAQ